MQFRCSIFSAEHDHPLLSSFATGNKPCKQKIAEFYDEWLSNRIHEFTESGNMKPVKRRMVLDWCCEGTQRRTKRGTGLVSGTSVAPSQHALIIYAY